jgi:hypothetical protein
MVIQIISLQYLIKMLRGDVLAEQHRAIGRIRSASGPMRTPPEWMSGS